MARNFDAASDDRIEVGDVPALNLTGNKVTLSLWVRLGTPNTEYKVFAKWDDAGGKFSYLLSIEGLSNRVLFAINTSGTTLTQGSTDIDDGKWHHIAGTYDGSNIRIYVDGVQENSAAKTGNMPSNTVPVRIGAAGGASIENAYDGDLGHAALWNATLTAGEIASLAVGISPLKIPRDDNLLFYAPINGQSPELDIIGGLDLTVNGTVKAEEPPIPNSIVAA